MRAIEVLAPYELQVVEKPVPDPEAGKVRVKVHWAGVCGTDYSLIAGKLTFARYPIVPGHEFSGRISAVGAGVDLRVGQPVTINPILSCRECPACLRGEINHCEKTAVLGVAGTPGGFADEVIVPADAIRGLPDDLPLEAGAMTEPVAVVVRVAHAAGIQPGDQVAILGAGNIGLLMLQMAFVAGASRVAIYDPVASRMAVARQLGADDLLPDDPVNEFDVVIDGIGKPETFALCVRMARRHDCRLRRAHAGAARAAHARHVPQGFARRLHPPVSRRLRRSHRAAAPPASRLGRHRHPPRDTRRDAGCRENRDG